MKQIVRILLILSTILLVFGCSKTPEEKMSELRQEFTEKLATFDYKGAEAIVGEMTKLDPTSPSALGSTGMIAEQKLWTVDAFDIYGSLMHLSPDAPEGYLGAYRVQKRLGTFDDAVTTADELGKVDAKNPQSVSILAEAVLQAGLPQLANRIIDSAQKIGLSQGEANFLRARAEFLLGHFDSARTLASSALANKNATPRYYEVAADYYETIGFADSSMLFSKQEMEAAKKLPLVWIHHFDRSLRLGYFAAAREVMRDVMKTGADSGVYWGMHADYYNSSKRYVEASNASIYLSSYAGITNLTRPLHELRATAGMMDMYQVNELLDAVTNPFKNAPMSDAARMYLVGYFYSTFAIEAEPRKGVEFIEDTYGPIIGKREFRAKWMSVLYLSGEFRRFDSLKAIFDQAYAPQYDWQMYVGDMYNRAGASHYEEAKERYENSLRVNPNYLPVFEHYQDMLENQARYQEAVQLYDRFPHFAASTPTLRLRQAAALVLVGQRDQGMQLFEANCKARSGDMRTITRFLDALTLKYDTEGKTQVLNTLAAIAPDNPDVITLLSTDAIDKKDFAKGKELAEKGIRLDPDNAVFHVLIGRARLGMGETETALQMVDSLYPLYQNAPDFVFQYSRLLAENGINLDKAANLARGSVMYSNYGIREYLNLIDIYYQMGRFDLSWNEAANVSATYPTRPEAFYRMGRAGVHIGKPDNKKLLEKSIALGLGGDELTDAKKILSQLN